MPDHMPPTPPDSELFITTVCMLASSDETINYVLNILLHTVMNIQIIYKDKMNFTHFNILT